MSIKRLLKRPGTSFFLLGIRGVGKSTWARSNYPGAHTINLLDEQVYQDLLLDVGIFSKQLKTLPKKSWVIVDEIQRLPSLLNEVHRAIEEQELEFALLGSSARKLRRDGTNLLGGRALQIFMHPFTPYELGESFSLTQALTYGTIPLIHSAESPRDQLVAYVQLYLREEIQAAALVRNLPGFSRFLPIAALFHGQIINAESLGRDAGVNRTTVLNYLSILEDTLLAFRLPAYDGRLRVKERKLPKLYFCDAGLVRAAKRQLGPLALEERGSLFEGFFIQLIKSYHECGVLDYDEMFFWAVGKNGPEVDVILTRGNDLVAIEFKATKRLRNEHFKGLRTITEKKNVRRRILVYEGERPFIEDTKIEVLPVAGFLEELRKGLA